jgi:hypothetical protein
MPEPTEQDRIKQIIRNETAPLTIGRVAAVRTRSSKSTISNHEADVTLLRYDQTHRDIPIATPASEAISVPQVDDLVIVGYLESDERRPIVLATVFGDAAGDRAPVGDEGDVRLRRGSIYAELAGDGSVARLAKKPGDDAAPDASVAVEDDGAITIETSGDVTISAGGDVLINEGGNTKSVLTKDAVFEYEQRIDTSDGSGGTQTKTTSVVSNGETTETQIE